MTSVRLSLPMVSNYTSMLMTVRCMFFFHLTLFHRLLLSSLPAWPG